MRREEQCAIPLKSPHQRAEIRPACLQYPLSHPKKSHPRRFSSKCGKILGYFMSFRSCPPHNAVHCSTFKLHSFPSFSSVGSKHQSPGILILILPYYSYLMYFLFIWRHTSWPQNLSFYRFTNIFTCYYNIFGSITQRSSYTGNAMKIRIAKHFGPIQQITVSPLTSVLNKTYWNQVYSP